MEEIELVINWPFELVNLFYINYSFHDNALYNHR